MSYKMTISEPILVYEGPTLNAGWGPAQFPVIYKLCDSRLLVSFALCRDIGQDEGLPGGYRISSDNGKSWQDVSPDEMKCVEGQAGILLPSGKYLRSIVKKPIPTEKDSFLKFPRARFADSEDHVFTYRAMIPAEDISDDIVSKNWTFETYDPATGEKESFECKLNYPGQCITLMQEHISVPHPMGIPIIAPDGSLWMPHYDWGRDPETMEYTLPYFICSYFKSTDEGKTFNMNSCIKYNPHKYSFPGAYIAEGFCEPCLNFAPDGSMITLLRTGGAYFRRSTPTYIARSTDGGNSWSDPEMFDSIGVWPQLLPLKCGVTLASYGRPGVFIRATDDEKCLEWDEPVEIFAETGRNVDAHLADTCGYTGLVAVDDNTAVMVYTDFTRLDNDGNRRKCILSRTIHIEK